MTEFQTAPYPIMNQPDVLTTENIDTLAFIFTNASGNVIFADRGYLQLIGDPSHRSISGEMLNNILPISAESANQLMNMTRRSLHLDQVAIPIHTVDGTTLKSNCTAIAALDEKGNFIGADLVLQFPPVEEAGIAAKFQTHNDVVKAFVENVMSEGNQQYARTFFQSYLVAQVEVIQILLSRISGLAARNAFEMVVNESSKSKALPISMRSGHLEFERNDINIQGYRSFINALVGYAVDVLGRQAVKREVLMVDKFVGSGTLELITQMDLRIFLAD